MTVLAAHGVTLKYNTGHDYVTALREVSLDLESGDSLGLVGESGCGKSSLVSAFLGIVPPTGRIVSGAIEFGGRQLIGMPEEEFRQLRGTGLAYIPQGASVALSPVISIWKNFVQTWKAHGRRDLVELRARAENLFASVELAPELLDVFPHQMSGGMRQRAIIALALLFNPACLIADEPTTGLDVIVQRDVLNVLAHLRQEQGMSLLFVSHDIAVVSELCNRIAVMYAGRIIEIGKTRQVLSFPRHPYTMALKKAFPDIRHPKEQLTSIPGRMPLMNEDIAGCAFADRCPFVEERCRIEVPPLRKTPVGASACHFSENADEMRGALKYIVEQ